MMAGSGWQWLVLIGNVLMGASALLLGAYLSGRLGAGFLLWPFFVLVDLGVHVSRTEPYMLLALPAILATPLILPGALGGLIGYGLLSQLRITPGWPLSDGERLKAGRLGLAFLIAWILFTPLDVFGFYR